ncbi:uncharacterized protein Dwil_GK25740 [Drosophila willistoni]|uniref:Uncharacterized protein n=1 Tax=Drosophila willistoni TaxID=7260 RepID=B4NBW4_DROWI|nr:probable cytochrome P450 311a1 [Drosophila willistoni]EDW82323.2 uncharacterized protein Dwil_GK25740 [Drosophila willistoni]
MPLWLVFVLCLGLIVFLRKWPLLRLGCRLPGPWAFPLLGNAQMVGKLKPEFIFLVFTELRERFGSTYRLWLGPQLWVFLHTAEETRQALHDPTLRKAETFLQLEPLIGNGLLISHGAHWTRQRRLLTPAFQPQILRRFAHPVAMHADRLIARLKDLQGASIEVTDHLFSCLLDAIVDTSMGRQLDTQLMTEHSPIIRAFHLSSELLFKRMINPLLASDWIFQRTKLWRRLRVQLEIIHQLMETVIEERARELQDAEQNKSDKSRTLLDTLLLARFNDGSSLSRQEIRDEINTFVFAGVDTTTAAMSFVLYGLAKHQEIQDKLLNEIKEEQANDLDALNELPYLDAVIKEILRLYTIVPTTGRQTTCSTIIGGQRYCAGITLWINMYGLAHDAIYYAEPYDFKPERWLASGSSPPPPFSYIPFSGGPHVCIGRRYSLLLMKLLTVRIVQTFRLKLRPEDEAKDLILQAQMVLKSRNGIHVAFVERSSL